ncbi:prepilin-type N-terminal cleavage/methylation domain-containing protein [Desulfurivibrio dismutans]|uniref:prepilin-type N-terminal cleavage/methylation domain-containing protein n=1 Tax=Desulfurivibrio dismutans TaxID=1398908 RepID=UPI0023DA0075|nr:prepilin-type N-terminal cleavage/methylation domain-containing protein [Desulfurivibrio alkaliphilus]MDF1615444.1 prepilin-type N-terminal cleavage/methylation domain-containing protein [Desulfurivibrio alkaliphilus]
MFARPAKNRRQCGFTLIEVIAVLVLAAMLAAIAGAGLTAIARGYLMARESTAMAQKAQLALTRLSSELQVCYDCIGADEPIDLPFTYNNILGSMSIAQSDDTITLDGAPLIDGVIDSSLAYDAAGLVVITFSLEHQQTGSALEFTTSVLPRNSYQ